jgi:hypothetical protein
LLGYFQTKDQSHTFENGMLMKIVIRQGVHDWTCLNRLSNGLRW